MRWLSLLLVGLVTVGGCRQQGEPTAVGTLERYRIELRAEQQEPLLRLAVSEGDAVAPGDVVVELDARRPTARRDEARAYRDLQAARLAEIVRGARDEDIAEARATLKEAEAALIRQEPDLRRVTRLVDEGVETPAALDEARAAEAAAAARVVASRAALERLLNGATVEELDQARAGVAQGEAQVARLEVDVQRMTVRAPRAAVVDALPFRVGDEPPAGSVVAVLLADGAPFARVYVPAELRPAIRPGQTATVQVEGLATAFEGRIRMVSSEAAFTPYYALTERDRGRLSYLAEIDLVGEAARELPTGVPVEVTF